MPAKITSISSSPVKILRDLGQRLRDHRKQQEISAIAAAEAAGLSRVTLYRIEKGESSVTMGAYISVIFALGLSFELKNSQEFIPSRKLTKPKLPEKIRIAHYKQLKRLAWQLKDVQELGPEEALDLYERNWRHVDVKTMDRREQKFLQQLLAAFGRERLLV